MERIVIIGSGQGGQQAASSLRQEGYQGQILLLGEEPGLPYQRPPLSKAYMANGDAGALTLKPASFYDRAAISLQDRTRVSRIERVTREVVTEAGARHAYDHLILATGARNFRPPIAGLDAPGVVELRTLSDAAHIRDSLAATGHAVVIGGGFIGLEFAAMARAAGVAVTVIEASPRLMARAVSPGMSARFLELHREMGCTIIFDALADAILHDPHGAAAGVALRDGRQIAGDLVLVATGVRPNVELAADAGLVCDNGIRVDGQLLTSDPAISALGDVASFPDPDGVHIRLESVQAAVDHARHIARRLVHGSAADYAALPWFWSDQGKFKLQIAGLSTGADRVMSLPQPQAELLVLAFRAGRLIAVETLSAPALHMAGRRLIGASFEMLEAHGFDLRAAVKAMAEPV
ncbi:NAD(P)/FAD-dependent oxidoreductase [Paracoccus litorisediminis]|uniref:Pyridine nucleotide-disulfide oxidoreductase n=1 Tax=Paracoccus litorisediminis TaxID=2006130 RepID=A0A844HT62_9RHOB|nr:FAD-dependent oxidoreductase [Paracoccus litorisediminis]MTH62278.1 pyridine nucleotide-disulfide oxidoreductase [Paracoccus litorisediminis]